jgi:acetolactate synthase-1/2/3 large subunit
MSEAFTRLTRGRPRPYVLEVPLDVLSDEAEIDPVSAELPPVAAPGADAIGSAAALIRGAARPLLLAGGGAQGAASDVVALAERLDAPVVLTSNGVGVVPADHPLYLGGADVFKEWADRSDLLIAVGTRFGQMSLRSWKGPPERLIHLDIDPTVIGSQHAPDVALLGDARAGLTALLDALGENPRGSGGSVWPNDSAPEGGRQVSEDDRQSIEILNTLRDSLSRDAVLTYDMNMVCYRAPRAFPVYVPRGIMGPSCYGSLGFAVPAAIGAKLACPSREVVALCGDGGFFFTAQELSTACQQTLCLPIIVFNDNAYASIRGLQDRDRGGRRIGVELKNPDFLQFAESFGVSGARVASSRALGEALGQALASDMPTLIEVDVEAYEF